MINLVKMLFEYFRFGKAKFNFESFFVQKMIDYHNYCKGDSVQKIISGQLKSGLLNL